MTNLATLYCIVQTHFLLMERVVITPERPNLGMKEHTCRWHKKEYDAGTCNTTVPDDTQYLTIIFCGHGWNADGCTRLLKSIHYPKCLKFLRINHGELDQKAMVFLSHIITPLNLMNLTFKRVQFHRSAFKSFRLSKKLSMFAIYNTPLHTRSADNPNNPDNPDNPNTAETWFHNFCKYSDLQQSNLRYLDLSRNSLGGACLGLQHILPSSLHDLDLSKNNLKDEDISGLLHGTREKPFFEYE